VAILYLPSAYAIEMFGINPAITFSMILTTFGLWIAHLDKPTIGSVFVGIATPFVLNTTTKVSGSWFGPKGRNLATMVMLIGFFGPQSIEEFFDKNELSKGLFPLACICSALTPLCYLLIYDKPDFSPTMSEEEKLVIKEKGHYFDFMSQVRLMLKNKIFKMTSVASVLIMVSNDLVHRILEILHYEIYKKDRNDNFNKPLYRVCMTAGILTFGCALYSKLSLKFGYKLLIYQFFLSKI
jgi:hypothetical protein